jgi:hypothetical protein
MLNRRQFNQSVVAALVLPFTLPEGKEQIPKLILPYGNPVTVMRNEFFVPLDEHSFSWFESYCEEHHDKTFIVKGELAHCKIMFHLVDYCCKKFGGVARWKQGKVHLEFAPEWMNTVRRQDRQTQA